MRLTSVELLLEPILSAIESKEARSVFSESMPWTSVMSRAFVRGNRDIAGFVSPKSGKYFVDAADEPTISTTETSEKPPSPGLDADIWRCSGAEGRRRRPAHAK